MTRAEAEDILEATEETDCLFMDGFDAAIIGVGKQYTKEVLVVYDRNKCIQILMDRDGMSHEEAEEFFSFNTDCAWFGPKTPMIVETGSEA